MYLRSRIIFQYLFSKCIIIIIHSFNQSIIITLTVRTYYSIDFCCCSTHYSRHPSRQQPSSKSRVALALQHAVVLVPKWCWYQRRQLWQPTQIRSELSRRGVLLHHTMHTTVYLKKHTDAPSFFMDETKVNIEL